MENKLKQCLDDKYILLRNEIDKFKKYVNDLNESNISNDRLSIIDTYLLTITKLKINYQWILDVFNNMDGENEIIINNDMDFGSSLKIIKKPIKINYKKTIKDIKMKFLEEYKTVSLYNPKKIYFSDCITNSIKIYDNLSEELNDDMQIYELNDIFRPTLNFRYESNLITLKLGQIYFIFDGNKIIFEAINFIKNTLNLGDINFSYYKNRNHEILLSAKSNLVVQPHEIDPIKKLNDEFKNNNIIHEITMI